MNYNNKNIDFIKKSMKKAKAKGKKRAALRGWGAAKPGY